jgi:PAS domain S-box-containing protein
VKITLSHYTKGKEQFVIAFISNITARKETDQKIAALNTALEAKVSSRTADLEHTLQQLEFSKDELEEAQAFQKALFDNAGAMIIATDEKGTIKFFNPEASRCIGYSQEEIINHYSPLLFHDPREIIRKRQELSRKYGCAPENDFAVLVEKSVRNIHGEEQYTYIRKNKTTFPVLLSITAIRNTAGQIIGYIGIAIDISARKKAEENLLETLRKEKELGELKSRFVSMASHEFRTPLSTVLSSAYLIEKYTTAGEQPKRERHLQRIISAVSTLTDILNDFLSVGKIEEGKIQVRPSHIHIKEYFITLIKDLKSALQSQQIIRYRHHGDEEVSLDATLLKHIVMNLVSNASKFSAPGSIITIHTKAKEGQFRLSVNDQGIGISAQDQQHLMERFFRGANAGNIQGTGLGLHIVSKYAELLNGVVQCKSELGKGTRFLLLFTTKNNEHEKDTADRRQ